MARANTEPPHRWRFFRAGGVDQVRLDTGADLENLPRLDQKLWLALSCPVQGVEFDERTLELIDRDKDGRVRAPEILDAVGWACARLKSADDLVKEEDGVPLDAIDGRTPLGREVLGAARFMLASLGRADAAAVTVGDAMEASAVFNRARLNGDGIVPPDAIADAEARAVAEDVVACLGGALDRSGRPGVDRERLTAFFDALPAFDAWWREGESDPAVSFLGDGTHAAHEALERVRAKVDDYFTRCRLAACDPRAAAPLSAGDADYAALAGRELTAAAVEIARLPLQSIGAGRPLDVGGACNPAWEAPLRRFRDAVVRPLLGEERDELSAAEWDEVKARFAAYEAWLGRKAGAAVQSLGIARVRSIAGTGGRAAIEQAIAEDLSVAAEARAVDDLERLARYYRDLHRLLVNFVSFEDFYTRRRPALFQAGTLYLDGRSCELCVRVGEPGAHATLAGLARTYIAYCDCRRATGGRMTIAAAFTAGDADHLMVGRNGIFYDRKGRDWDATITRILESPIGVGQAFLLPYKRLLRRIEEQVAKRAAAADASAAEKLEAAVPGQPPPPGEPLRLRGRFDVGVVAALGVAFAGITATLGVLLEAFFGLGFWMPLGVLAIVLFISGPSMLIAWLKLRQRSLGPLLDANGWAINGRARVNVPLGASLTARAEIPKGSSRSFADPFAARRRVWPRLVLALLVVALAVFLLHRAGYAPVTEAVARARSWLGLD